MPTLARIDVSEIAAATVAILDQRETKSQAAQRAAKALADAEAQRAEREAAEAVRAQRHADEATLRLMERHLGEIVNEIEALTAQWKALPRKISALGLNHSRLLSELAALRQKMGV